MAVGPRTRPGGRGVYAPAVSASRDPIGPLLDMNRGRVPVDKLNALAGKIRRARLSLTVLTERVVVDDRGVVTSEMDLCLHCRGTCCQELRIPITKKDVKRLAAHLDVRPRDVPLLDAPDDLDDEEREALPEGYAGYLSHGEGPCPYFHGRCTVHEARPEVCRNYGLHACALEGTFQPAEIKVRKKSSTKRRNAR